MGHIAWWQFALLFWASVCFFAAGARSKAIALTFGVWLEVMQAALIVVLLFGLLTEGGGCRAPGSTLEDSAGLLVAGSLA